MDSPPSLTPEEAASPPSLSESDHSPPSLSDEDDPVTVDEPRPADVEARVCALRALLSPDCLETSLARLEDDASLLRLFAPAVAWGCRLLSSADLEGRVVAAARPFEHRVVLVNVGRKSWPAGWSVRLAHGEDALQVAQEWVVCWGRLAHRASRQVVSARGCGAPLAWGDVVHVTLSLRVAPHVGPGPCAAYFCVDIGGKRIEHEWSVLVSIKA